MTRDDLEYTVRLSELEYIAKRRGISLNELIDEMIESNLNYLRNCDN